MRRITEQPYEQTKKGWRRVAFGKLLYGTATSIQTLVHTADGTWEFDRPGMNKSKVMTDRELAIWQSIRQNMIRECRRMTVLAWHIMGRKKPKGYKI